MKKTLVFTLIGAVVALLTYEGTFRYQTSNYAGVEFRNNEARIYYDYDLASGERWRYLFFSARIYAPIGSIQIKKSGGIHLVRGKLYKKDMDGSLRDWSEVLRRYNEKKNQPNQALQRTSMAVTDRAPSSTLRANHARL